MSVVPEHGSELAHSGGLVLQNTPSNNPMHARTTLKDAGMHPHA